MKLQSKIWFDRTINMPFESDVKFDKNGICEMDITDEQADHLVVSIQGLSIVEEGGTKKSSAKQKEKVIEGGEGKDGLENKEQIEKNQTELSEDQKKEAAAIEKQGAIDKINAIKKVKDLQTLAASFPAEEWQNMTKAVDLKNYLISKL